MLAVMTAAQIGGAVVQQGFGSLSPFIVESFHVNKAQLGAAFTAIMLGSAFTVGIGGVLVDRFGERAMTMFAGAGIFVTLTIGAISPSYAALVAWLFIMGLTYGAMTPAGGRAILAWFDRDRGFAMSVRQMGVPIGAAVGGFMLPYLASHFNVRTALIGGGIMAIVLTTGCTYFYREPREDAFPPPRLRHMFAGLVSLIRDRRTVFLSMTCMVLAVSQQTMVGFLALTAVTRAHVSVTLGAAAFIVAQIASMLGRLVWGRMSDVTFGGDRVMPIMLACLLVAMAAAGLAVTSSGELALLMGSAFVFGFSGAGWNGLFPAAMAEIGGARFAGTAIGIGLSAVFLAGALGPVAFGAIADALGLRLAWCCIAVLGVLAVVPAFAARRAFAHARSHERAAMG